MKKILTLIAVAGIIASCNMPNNTMNDKGAKNEARFQAFYDQVMNAHNTALIDSFCTADFVDHNPLMGHSGKGLDDLKAEFKDYYTSYPDMQIKTEYMISKGDTVFAKVRMTGTNSGPMMGGMPATNKPIDIEGVDVIVLKDGKATDRWGYFEDMKMMKQLGMMPDMGKMHDQMTDAGGKMENMDKKK